MSKNNFQCLFISLLLVLTMSSQMNAADILSGRVYEGNKGTEPPTSTALSGVTVKLYGSNNSDNIGTQIGTTTTDSLGWYGLTATVGFEYYTIEETDPSDYYSVGATSPGGTVINNNQIRYSTASAPLSNQTLTGNKFWDKPDTPANNSPTADAGGPYTGNVGQSITLDGSGSTDPDAGDSIVSYEWDIDNDGQYDDATGVTVQYTWNSVYSGTVGLRVTDSFGDTDTDQASVLISELPNNSPTADAGGPYTGNVGQSITLDGSGSYDPDSGDSIVSYEWDIDNDGQYDDATGITVQHTWNSAHNGTVGLRVTDSFGETDTDQTSISITADEPENNPPVADANGPYTGTVGQSITLDGSSSYDPDSGDSIVSYEWDIDNDGQFDDATGITTQYTWNSVHNGTVGLRVTDSFGETDTDQASVVINEGEPETGTIIVEKQTEPDSSTDYFDFSGDAAGSIKDGEQLSVSNLQPGTYTSQEIVPQG